MSGADQAEPTESFDQFTPLLLTMRQVADLCQVSLATVREWSYDPTFPVIRKHGHFVRIHARLLDEWLMRRSQEVNA